SPFDFTALYATGCSEVLSCGFLGSGDQNTAFQPALLSSAVSRSVPLRAEPLSFFASLATAVQVSPFPLAPKVSPRTSQTYDLQSSSFTPPGAALEHCWP